MKVKDCMCNEVCCVSPNSTIKDCAKLMMDNHIGCVPICDDSQKVVGVVTDRDIILRTIACDKDVKTTPVSDIMSCNVCCCTPNTDINEAEKMMSQNQIRRIPVIDNDKIVGIGEIGLDYYWNKENKEIQKQAFIMQIELANRLNLPITIHTREAVSDTLEILKQHPVQQKGVFHCCPLNRELVKEALKLGFYISFAGPVTFKNSKNAQEIVEMVPNDRMLIETDSPYLAPEPVRGTRNDSRNVRYIAEKIANIKSLSTEEIAEITYQNTLKIFKI